MTYTMYTSSLVNWAGGDVKLRFHLSGDLIYSGGTWWVDEVSVNKAMVPGSCSSASAGPPPIPGGGAVAGQPMRAGKSDSNVVVTWDAAQCPAAAVNVYRGAIGPDGWLYLLGHDRPEMYVVGRPPMGPVLSHIATVSLEAEGQAFSWAKTGRTVFAIDRRQRLVRTIEIPAVTPRDTTARRFR